MKPRDKLYQIAYRQQGYFTAKQATLAGYADSAPTYHVAAGNWVREDRGIYRLSHFPEHDRCDAIIYWLWTVDRRGKPLGVYSHQTALDAHDLCDINPRKLFMTVPPDFRRRTYPPVLILRRGNLQQNEITSEAGIPITTVYRTLVDLIREQSVSPEQLVMALETALERGLLDKKSLANLRDELHPHVQFLDFLLENLKHGSQG